MKSRQILVLLLDVALTLSTSAYVGLAIIVGGFLLRSLSRHEGFARRRYRLGWIIVAVGLVVVNEAELSRVADQRIGGRPLHGKDGA